VLDRLVALTAEYHRVQEELAEPDVYSDQKRARDLARRNKQLEPIVAAANAYRSAIEDRDAAKDMMTGAEGDEREYYKEVLATADADIERLEEELKILLLPRDPNDDKNVILEIRGAEGGEEANLFAKDLADMYQKFAVLQGWKTEILEADESERGGYNEVIFMVKGDGVWSKLKHEGGAHRVQRVPDTESQGRIHTSAATVTVLPEAEEIDVEMDMNDLRIDVYRSSGPGGQSVNTTDSAVRVTHIPTGIVVAMQDEKSQIQNRAKALQVLRSRLLKAEQDKQAAERSAAVKSQVGTGSRGEKIRTYNFKENRVTDHRIGLTLYSLSRVLQGELEDVVNALVADEQTRLLTSSND
jgi:peptide chain release factor 1